MNWTRCKVGLLFLPLVFLLLVGQVWASENFSQYNSSARFMRDFSSCRVMAILSEEEDETLLLDGFFRFKFPHDFQIQYFTNQSPVLITGHDGFLEVQVGQELEYGFDDHWLFNTFEQYVFAFAQLTQEPLKFLGMDQVLSIEVERYAHSDDPSLTFWIEPQSRLPVLIRRGNEDLLTLASYTRVAGETDFTGFQIGLHFGQYPAKLSVAFEEGRWVPSALEVEKTIGKLQLKFSEWSFSPDWSIGQIGRLKKLKELNEAFFVEFDEENWETALEITQEMKALVPRFWQAHLFQAFVYDALDNFWGVVENYQQVLMIHPEHHLALNNLAYHYFLKEVQIPQALEMAEKAVQLERDAAYLHTLGYGYYLVGRHEEALELMSEALENAPKEALGEIESHLELIRQALNEGE